MAFSFFWGLLIGNVHRNLNFFAFQGKNILASETSKDNLIIKKSFLISLVDEIIPIKERPKLQTIYKIL